MNLNDPKIVAAIENAVCSQIEASGITADPFRLDGEKIVDVILEQLEGFVLVPKELSDEKADAQALLAWSCHAGLFKSQNRDMSALQVEEFRLKWCKRKARELQEEYRVAIKAQEQGHE